ncbi:protein mono-ADP-ribosyltransferase PARP14-like isoform X2 [Rana temporaria]|uniref:protein mono-ADP-ribosyltransferase PARP14-like isoform X2 n=1 Tax=Rana temporaria TaxID=8407 RepID=UPI001AAD60D8|nr:protein mono-ADP-ribosyltransferase PARP14-like isoform X2 [Rana temporaria]
MGDPKYPYPVALQWKEDPEVLKKLKNKLLLYFQKRSESNGGECEIRDTDCARGHILIHFKEETARDGVLKKDTHELKLPGGKKMKLDVRSQGADGGRRPVEQPEVSKVDPTPQPQAAEAPSNQSQHVTQEPPSSLILIENLQDSYSSEMLNLLVENISGANGDTDFQVERIPEKQCAVITFTCDIDILGFVENFSKNSKIRTSKMKVKPLKETRTIRVEGLPPNTPEDYIGLYFENPKHGVPGSTEDTVAIPEEGAALVTFSTVEAAKKVLGRKHLFQKKEVSVYPYYPAQDIVLYGDQRPQIRTPEPLTFPVSRYILEFILSNDQFKDNMEKTMGTHTCEIKWPDLVCPNPVITLSFPEAQSTDLRLLVKLLPTWKDEVRLEFSRLISKYKVEEYKMDQSVWYVVKERANSSTYKGVLIKPELGSGKVFLVGLVKDIARIDPTFRQLIEETTKQVERKSQCMTESFPMSPTLYQIMCNGGLQKKILDKVPELKMDYDKSRKAIRLSGLRDEVLTAKNDILDIKQQMKTKSIQMNPHLVQFLMSTDNEELSSLLFVRHKIIAMLEIEDDAVQLTAYSKKDLMEAEEQMNQELICREVPVEEKSTLKIPEWESLQSHLLESHNAEKITVLILDSRSGAENNVVIAGLSSNVGKCYQKVSDFLEKNTPMNKNIKVKSTVVMQFLKDEKKQMLDGLKNDNLSVTIQNKMIRLRGPKIYVVEAHSHISNVLSSICSDTLIIDKPGAKKVCLTNEEIYVTMAKNNYSCLIRLQKEEEEEETEEEEPEELEGSQCQINLPNGMVISVHKDDLCRHRADVIVNAANEDLKHVGGLALALLKAAGPKLQDDSDQIVKSEGRLSAGESVITDSGRLPCKQVIHTVGPRWYSEPPGKRERLLQKAITSSLDLAEEYCHTSIAIPAISSGIFGCPVDQSAENIIKAVKEYVDRKPKGQSTIKEIRLVDTNVDTIRIFSSTLKRMFGKEEAEPSPKYRGNRTERGERHVPSERVSEPQVSTSEPRRSAHEPRASANQMMTKENIVIRVREGLIQDAATEAIVNSVGKDLNLGSGGASRALLNKAGDKLQQCLKEVTYGVQPDEGSVFTTEGCNLKCRIVIHVVVPAWNGKQSSSEKIFRDIVRSCLCESEKKKLRSISFPAIGTGVLGFPKRAAASFMFEEILKFSSKSNAQHLREVNFILHPSDRDTLTEFSKELNSRTDRNVTVSFESDMSAPGTSRSSHAIDGAGSVVYGTASTPSSGTHELTIGSVTYQVKTGDITKEDTDIIVNSTDKSFTMRSGVSKAILDAAGQSVIDECIQLGSRGNKDHIVTQNGNLRCKKILHMLGTNSASGIKSFITKALTECARLQATSVAFPAIGTGMGNVSSSEVADSILESVADFARSPQSVRMVKVVIFQKQMLNDFHGSMKRKEGRSLPRQEGFFAKMKDSFLGFMGWNTEGSEASKVFELRENIEPAIFQLCAESPGAVDRTKVWLRDLIMKEQSENVITEDWIQEFDEKDQEALFQLQKTFQVSLTIDLPNFTVKVMGLSRDVLEVSNKIQEMIKIVREKKTREREAELCSNLVEWGYLNGTNFIPFDKMTNMELEKAKNEDRQSIKIHINRAQYTVIVERKTASDPRGNSVKLQRNSKHEKLDVPQNWDTMNNENMKVVPLGAGSQEFMDVDAQFKRTCPMRIIKIERIQNRHLWINYKIKKQSIDDKNGSTTNEKQLFHGLDSNTVNSVNHNGFNRSYAGKNAACYGNGTYFAVNANYSAQDTYSRPDGKGYKYMYLARVVTGVSCVGRQGMIAPPPKNASNPTDLHDSVTDNVANPVMYVIFHDIQAYPEYLITFTQ